MRRSLALIPAAALALGACAMNDGMTGGDAAAVADLTTANGQAVGRATASESNGNIVVSLDARNMPPGVHAVHVHTTGRCDAPGFESAGGHWNPTNAQHGTQNPAGPHAGDMPNVTIAADGSGSGQFTLPAGTLDGMFDADGSAFIVHAGADDLRTDPSGNAGGRIACGVFRRS
ncbi:superoxide dismutase family protein [Sphingomonas baiyangensis]|uniref:Superoxide dismutase family protein n=1 Tax=Sphingomonas baiyangensis TaxID=2572576 RepID=A0A4U1L541_9SPHN|nr:superoxide dismutase family protein [Sphingomonas baiyangensis]TKD52019.1 superoxide dismutase family protein [Sphingomonas baiyangensis]